MNNDVVSTSTQIPWAAVITALAGVIGALGGAFLANFFADKRWDKQIEHERGKEHEALMRVKGEETYLTLKRWGKELYFFNSSRIGHVQGVISLDEVNKTIDEKVSPDTHVKLDVLFAVYFSDLSQDLESIHRQTNELNKCFHKYSQLIPNLPGAEYMKKEAAVYERQLELLERKLRIKLKEFI